MKIYQDNNKRIAFFTAIPLEYGGGAEIITINTARLLAGKKGYSVDIYALLADPTNKNNVFKGFFYRLMYRKKITSDSLRLSHDDVTQKLGKASYKRMGVLKAIGAMHKADYLFVKNDLPYLIPVALAVITKPSMRKKIIIQFHTILKVPNDISVGTRFHNIVYLSPFYQLLIHLVSKKYQVLNTSDKKRLKGASLIKMPCDDMFFTGPKANITIGSKKNVIIAGRLTAEKGIDMLPSLLRYLSKKKVIDNFRFYIAGSGGMESTIIDLTKKYKNVKYKKNINHDNMPEFLTKGNIFLMMSRFEGSPLSLAEAMATGLIIVAFKIPGIFSKKIKDYISFAPPYDIKILADQLIRLSNTKTAALKDMSTENIEYAKRNYTMESYIKKIENLLYS